MLISGVHFDFSLKEAELQVRRLQKNVSPKSVTFRRNRLNEMLGTPTRHPPPLGFYFLSVKVLNVDNIVFSDKHSEMIRATDFVIEISTFLIE